MQVVKNFHVPPVNRSVRDHTTPFVAGARKHTSLKTPPEIKTQETRDVKLKFIPHCPSQTMRDGFLETSAPWREGMAWKLLGCYNFKQGRLAVVVLVGGYSETRMVDSTAIRRGDGWEWGKTPRGKLRSGM